MKTECKGKTPYRKKHKHTRTVQRVCSQQVCFLIGDFFDQIKMCSGKDRVEKFADHIEDKVKQLHETFPQEPMWL